jgi:hypothetical protein
MTSPSEDSFRRWFERRTKPGTLAFLIRRLREKRVPYSRALTSFKLLWLWESLVAHGGVVSKAAREIGQQRQNMPEYFQKLGICKDEAVEIAKQVNGGQR